MKLFTHTINTKENSSLKALVLSDLHIYDFNDIVKIRVVLEKIEKGTYDAIFIVGDILDSTNILKDSFNTSLLLEFISFLGYMAPTYIVYASHDIGYFSKKQGWILDEVTFKDKFLNNIINRHGINVLCNETKEIKNGYTVTGINLPIFHDTTFEEISKMLEMSNFSFLNELDENKTNTLLCHYPNVLIKMYELGLLKNIDLSIAGHNHNGITQFKFFPLEYLLDLIGEKKRGLITPDKSINLNDTKILRGTYKLDERNTLLINPAFKTLANCTGILEKFDWLFYDGGTIVEYKPLELIKKK